MIQSRRDTDFTQEVVVATSMGELRPDDLDAGPVRETRPPYATADLALDFIPVNKSVAHSLKDLAHVSGAASLGGVIARTGGSFVVA